MNGRYRINLLIPFLDGEYYGNIFTTLHSEAVKRESTLFTIQALATIENPTAFDYQIGTEVTDGWLLLTNPHSVLPSSTKFLEGIKSSGKPVITVGYKEDVIDCHAVVVDNRQAIKDAIFHLIKEHGHRRIGFIGGTEHVDLIERFEGYKEALHECGIPFDEELYVQTDDSLRVGGEYAAETLLKRGVDFTAVVAATDLNAMGLITRLQDKGYDVPGDIAVIGFDDIPASKTFNPPLTTIYQPIADLARVSIDLLYQQIAGEKLESGTTYIPTKFEGRASCGCAHESEQMPLELMQEKLVQTEANVNHLIRSHNQFATNWASAARGELFDFSKMFTGMCHWGCLAMWDTSNDHKHLVITQSFSKDGEPAPPVGLRIPIEQFPLETWLPKMGEDEFVRVQSIRSDREDLGFIVLVGPVDKLALISEVDVTRISCNISVTALVRDQLFNQVRSIADQLEIVSRTTNDGIWDWDLKSNTIHWSTRTHDMINSIGETLTDEPDSLFRLIHPEDFFHMREEFKKHIEHGSPLKVEFRIQSKHTDDELWLYAAGDSILDQNGNKVRIIGSLTNISGKKEAERQITHLAFHDFLTGLPNRQMLKDHFQKCIIEAKKHNHMIGLMLIDLDRFKIINDTLGHHMGDKLLQEVANMLDKLVQAQSPASKAVRHRALVARLGGDEFIVLLTGVKAVSQLQDVADQMIERFQKPFQVEHLELFTTASIGISVYPENGEDLNMLTQCADIAMYKAKENGKNRSEIYNESTNSLTFERLTMENELRKALEREEFELHYQPQIDLETNEIYGFEALVRWRNPEHGLIAPNDFIPLAEDSMLIIPIGQWVLQEACEQKKKWIEQGIPPTVVSVNISASQLQQNDFVEMVKMVLEETELPSHCLCLEITETTAIMNWSNSINKLKELSELGIQIAIDDFGTGYSSLSMLKHLPITNVKIDSSFVRDMVINPDDAAIATAVISLARKLGLTVIAEGVETEDQRQLLMKERCHCIQGYIVSKPLPPHEYYEFMQNYMS